MIIDEIQHYQRYQEMVKIGSTLKEIYQLYQGGVFPTTNQELTPTIKINSVRFQAKEARKKKIFENHQQWLDIHFIFSGSEKILIGQPEKMVQTKAYNLENDIEFFEGKEQVALTLEAGQFLVCYPGEAHCVGVSGTLDKGMTIEKLVGKLKISD